MVQRTVLLIGLRRLRRICVMQKHVFACLLLILSVVYVRLGLISTARTCWFGTGDCSSSVSPWEPLRWTLITSRARTKAVCRAEYPVPSLSYWLLLIFTSAASMWNPCITSEPRVCIIQYIEFSGILNRYYF